MIKNFGLYNDKKSYINIEEQRHYKNERDNLYYLCNKGVENCETFSAVDKWINCIDEYIKINIVQSACHLFSSINPEKYYIDPNDSNNYIECSKYISSCYLYEYPNGCKNCDSVFIKLNK